MQDKIIKQERLVHELFLRSQYDQTNKQKFADYQAAQKELIRLKYAEAK